LNIVPNDWLGGYAAIGVFVPVGQAHITMGQANPEPICKFFAPHINKVVRAYKRSGLLRAIYQPDLLKHGDQIAHDFKNFGGNMDRYVVANVNGVYNCAIVPVGSELNE
jgi:hypothetical protein